MKSFFSSLRIIPLVGVLCLFSSYAWGGLVLEGGDVQKCVVSASSGRVLIKTHDADYFQVITHGASFSSRVRAKEADRTLVVSVSRSSDASAPGFVEIIIPYTADVILNLERESWCAFEPFYGRIGVSGVKKGCVTLREPQGVHIIGKSDRRSLVSASGGKLFVQDMFKGKVFGKRTRVATKGLFGRKKTISFHRKDFIEPESDDRSYATIFADHFSYLEGVSIKDASLYMEWYKKTFPESSLKPLLKKTMLMAFSHKGVSVDKVARASNLLQVIAARPFLTTILSAPAVGFFSASAHAFHMQDKKVLSIIGSMLSLVPLVTTLLRKRSAGLRRDAALARIWKRVRRVANEVDLSQYGSKGDVFKRDVKDLRSIALDGDMSEWRIGLVELYDAIKE